MGYVARYRKEAEEKNLPHWNRFVIAQLEEGSPDAIIAQHGYSTHHNPEFPKVLGSYEEAFAWLERLLTQSTPEWVRPSDEELEKAVEFARRRAGYGA
jgi:hypothetical protein